jgi:hypothetical protein
MVRGVVEEPRAPLPGDDVDDGALCVPELGGRSDGLNLDFLYEIDARLGPRDAVAGAREVRAVEQKLILVGARAEGGHRRIGAARRRRRRDPGCGPDRIEHAGAPRRDRLEILRTEACPESGVSRFDPRAGPLNDDRLGHAREVKERRPLDGGASPNGDGVFVIAANPSSSMSSAYCPGGNVEKRSWPLSSVVNDIGPPIKAAELTRTRAPGRTPPCASLTVPMIAPVSPCATATPGNRTQAATINSCEIGLNIFLAEANW